MKLHSKSHRVLGDTSYVEKHEFSLDVLPTVKYMIEIMQYHILPKGSVSVQSSVQIATEILADFVKSLSRVGWGNYSNFSETGHSQ